LIALSSFQAVVQVLPSALLPLRDTYQVAPDGVADGVVVCALRVDVGVADDETWVGVWVGVGVDVAELVAVFVGVAVFVAVGVEVTVGLDVGVDVEPVVGVAVETTGVVVCVVFHVDVEVGAIVPVGVCDGEPVGTLVGVIVGDGVLLAAPVGVTVDVSCLVPTI
jgi:hypothetical protein